MNNKLDDLPNGRKKEKTDPMTICLAINSFIALSYFPGWGFDFGLNTLFISFVVIIICIFFEKCSGANRLILLIPYILTVAGEYMALGIILKDTTEIHNIVLVIVALIGGAPGMLLRWGMESMNLIEK